MAELVFGKAEQSQEPVNVDARSPAC